MKLINNTKSKFITSKGSFLIGKIIDFDKEESKTLLRYNGIESVDSLEKTKSEYDLLKERAKSLGLEFASNISRVKLENLIKEAKPASEEEANSEEEGE